MKINLQEDERNANVRRGLLVLFRRGLMVMFRHGLLVLFRQMIHDKNVFRRYGHAWYVGNIVLFGC